MAKELKLIVKADISEFNTALGQMNSAIKAQTGNLLNAGRDIGFALTGIGTALAGGLGLAVKEFADAQKSSLQLDAALKSTGGSAGLTRTALDQLATSLSRVTTFDDDLITANEAVMLQFKNIGKDIFPKAMEAAEYEHSPWNRSSRGRNGCRKSSERSRARSEGYEVHDC
jgi:hypothetical protein